MFECINQYSAGIQAMVAICILFVTIAYSIATYFMYREMKNQRLLYETPEIQLRLEPISKTHFYFDLIIENNSNVSAYDLSLDVEPKDFEYFTNKKLVDAGYFNKPTKLFGVNVKSSICYIIINRIIEKYKSITIKATYKDIKGKIYFREFIIDFSQYFDSTEVLRDDIHDVSKGIKELNKHFEELIKTFLEKQNL